MPVEHEGNDLWNVQSKGPVPKRSAWGATRPMTANWAPGVNFKGIDVVTQSKEVGSNVAPPPPSPTG